MKTFADVKRRLSVGTVLECVENTYRPELNGHLRRVELIQSNGIACTTDLNQPWSGKRGDLFWTHWPKSARDVQPTDANTFRYRLAGSGHWVTLRFHNAGATP